MHDVGDVGRFSGEEDLPMVFYFYPPKQYRMSTFAVYYK